MDKARDSSLIHDHLGRHAAQLKQINFLPEAFKHAGLCVGQPNERKIIIAPIGIKGSCIFRTNNNYLSLPLNKFRMIQAQLRQMRAAVRSRESARKYQH